MPSLTDTSVKNQPSFHNVAPADYFSTPQPHHDLEKEVGLPPPTPEFNPCSNIPAYSPFYDHDSPRVSSEGLPKAYLQVRTRDLEAQSNSLSPVSTHEKRHSPAADSGRTRAWPLLKSRRSTLAQGNAWFGHRCQNPCMIERNPRNRWWRQLTRWQKLAVKLVIALFIVGAAVGIGIGISLKVGGGVNKNRNTTVPIT